MYECEPEIGQGALAHCVHAWALVEQNFRLLVLILDLGLKVGLIWWLTHFHRPKYLTDNNTGSLQLPFSRKGLLGIDVIIIFAASLLPKRPARH